MRLEYKKEANQGSCRQSASISTNDFHNMNIYDQTKQPNCKKKKKITICE